MSLRTAVMPSHGNALPGASRVGITLVLVGLIVLVLNVPSLPAREPKPAASPAVGPTLSAEPQPESSEILSQQELAATLLPPERVWTIDYQFRSLSNSGTAYEFGMPEPPPDGWSPLSRLEFPVNSLWHGLRVGFRKPQWEARFEWLTPIGKAIHGDLEDRDWMTPGADFTDLGIAQQRWIDGQMAELGLSLRLWDHCIGWPVDLWGITGFRWQRFNIMTYDLVQLKEDNVWPEDPYTYQGDVLSFHQQYYLTYLGGQLRTVLDLTFLPPITITFQGDWANAQAYNVDHHLLREGDRYTMERTHGDSWHVGLTAEAPITKHISAGLQADYLQIETRGRHRWLNEPLGVDESWTNGVHVWSDQTWLTAFIGFRI